MKTKNIVLESGKTISVYDDIFSAKELLHFYKYAQRSPYLLIRSSTGIKEDNAMLSLKCNLTYQQAIADLRLISSPNFKPFIKQAVDRDLRLARSYINLCTSNDLFPFHCDIYDAEDCLTMLYYMNTKWDPLWEGETHFANEAMTEIEATSSFVPGRLAVFNPTIPHKSSQPSMLAPNFRFTYAMFFVSKDTPAWENALDLTNFL